VECLIDLTEFHTPTEGRKEGRRLSIMKGASAAVPLYPKWSLVDIGINLTSEMYLGNYHHGGGRDAHAPDVDEVLDRAAKVGVRGLLITGGNLDESHAAIALAKKHHTKVMHCMATVGCHPTRCSEFLHFNGGADAYLEALDALIAEHSCRAHPDAGVVAAIGECGLDYDRLHFCPADVQQRFFTAQFDLSRKHKLPMFLHCRNTNGDFERIVREHRGDFTEGVVHSFTGTKEELSSLLDLGLFIGINGCSLKTAENLAVAKAVPLDRLLIETDGPYCDIKNTHASRDVINQLGDTSVSQRLLSQFPIVKKEKFSRGVMVRGRNEPCTIVEVLEVLYEVRKDDMEPGTTLEDFATAIHKNNAALFGFSL
jgi:TatD DNase family protein